MLKLVIPMSINGMANDVNNFKNACIKAAKAPVIYGWDAIALAWVHGQKIPGNEALSCRSPTRSD